MDIISKEDLEKYKPYLFLFCMEKLKNEKDALEAVKSVLENFYSKYRKIEKENILLYLLNIAQMVCIDVNKKMNFATSEISNFDDEVKKGRAIVKYIIHNATDGQLTKVLDELKFNPEVIRKFCEVQL